MTELNLLGRTLDGFEILSELGRGGMAVVYKARQSSPSRLVALKVLPPELSFDKSYIARFRQEADSVAALEHPHIVPIYSVDEADGYHYIAMKFINGRTLKDVVQEQGPVSVDQAIIFLEQIAGALDYAHSQGVIHRDIKPSNMMVDQNGWVYLTDFGLARGTANSGLTMAGTVMGTPEYMSPEQAQGLPTIGPSTDIYALGVVLYEMLTGKMPFDADTPMGMLVARLQRAPRPPSEYRGDLPVTVEDVIMRALARRPEARFSSAKELVEALKQAITYRPVPLSVPQKPYSPPQGTPAASPQSQQPLSEPQYVIQRPVSQPQVQPNVGATIAVNQVQNVATAPAHSSGPQSQPPHALPHQPPAKKSNRGLMIGCGVVALVMLIALGGGLYALGNIGREQQKIDDAIAAGNASLAQRGGLNNALASYTSALTLDPQNVIAHTQIALINNLRGQYQEAEKAARAAITADGSYAPAYAELADALNSMGDHEGALDAANKAVDLDTELSRGYGSRSSIQADQARDNTDLDLLKAAAENADKAIMEASDESNLAKALAHSARGYVYWQEYSMTDNTSKVKDGVEEFNQAIGLQPELALFHSNLGYFYDAQGEHDRAKEKFEAALDADPDYGHAHSGLGWNLYYLNDYQGAINEFDEALKYDPLDYDAYIGKSYAFQAKDPADYDQAIATLQKATTLAPKRPSIFTELGWAFRSKANTQEYGSDAQKQAYADAEQQFREALNLNDRYTDALTGLGWILQDRGSILEDNKLFEESVEVLKKTIEIKENQPYAHNALGWSLYNLEQYDEALESFTRAIELSAGYADAYYGLGRVYEAQGKPDEARQAYQTAVDNGSTSAQDALDNLK